MYPNLTRELGLSCMRQVLGSITSNIMIRKHIVIGFNSLH
jgi:hypothetical protein